MPGRLLLFGLVFALTSCRPAPFFVPTTTDGLLAVLTLSRSGNILSITTRYGGGEQPDRVEAGPLATTVVLVRLSEAALQAAVDDFDPSRASEVTLLLNANCQAGLSADGRSRRIALPQGAVFEHLDLSASPIEARPTNPGQVPVLEQVVLSAPVLSERCPVQGHGAIEPFSTDWSVLGRRATIAGEEWLDDRADRHIALGDWAHVVALDADHLLVQGIISLALLERGVSYEGRTVPSVQLPADLGNLTNLIVERDAAGRALQIWAIGGFLGGQGFIQEVQVDTNGPRFVGTSTRVPARLEDGVFDAAGTFLAVGGRNDVPGEATSGLVLELRRSPPSRRSVEIPDDPLTVIALSEIGERHQVVGSDGGSIYIGDIWNAAQRLQVSPNSMSAVAGIGLSGGDIIVSTLRSGLHRKDASAQAFSPLRLEIPAAYAACAGGPDTCGRLQQLAGRIESMSTNLDSDGTRRFYTTSSGCTGALALRAADGCMATIPDRDRIFELNGGRGWRGSTAYQRHVFFVGRDGTVGDLAL
jgi:hypothetical protein